MYNLETLLSIQKKRDNSNKKFPNSSNRKVYDRLQIDFDFPDPSILILSDAAKEHLNNMPKFMRDWQAEDMRNANVKDYYKNPVGDAINVILNIANRIIELVSYEDPNAYGQGFFVAPRVIVTGLEEVYAAAINLQGVSCDFLCHTNRLSNVVPIYGDCTGSPCNKKANATDPHYLTCSALNRTMLYLVHETDGISDARPILGTFTSLLIFDELVASGVKIISYPDMIEESLTAFGPDSPGGFYTDLNPPEIIEIVFNLTDIATSIGDRVEHDKRVWRNVKMLNEEQNVFKVMNEMGQTQTRLVRDYIGTDKLKRSLLIEDLPSLKYDVIIDYFGNVKYTPNTKWEMPPDANTPTSILDDYFDYYSNNRIEFEPPPDDEGNTIYSLEVFPGALIFNTENGLWSNNQIVTITNVGNTAYSYSNVNFNDFSKTEFRYEFDVLSVPRIISPTYGTVLDNTTIDFHWTNAGKNATKYKFLIGTTRGDNDIYDSGDISNFNTNLYEENFYAFTISGLPDDGSIIYVRFYYKINNVYNYTDYEYVSKNGLSIPRITNIQNGETLKSSRLYLEWESGEQVIDSYWIYIGITPIGYEIHDIELSSSTNSWYYDIPMENTPIYVTLWYEISGTWYEPSYTFIREVPSNIIGVGNSAQFIVAARGIEDEDFVEYGFCKIIPGIDLGIKVINSFDDIGVISPLQIINIYGSEDEKLILNTNNGPYPIVATESPTYNPYTWINNSEYPATISTIENITDSANLSNMTIHFINANTPATLNVTDKVLWYANVIPHITTPNNFTYKITTEDGQERTIILGVYGGNLGGDDGQDPGNGGGPGDGVDDSALYNETLNTTPDLIVANGQSFIINIANGKPRTSFTYSGPDLNGTATLDANGNYSLVNSDGITSNGYYTYIFTFDGTDRTRTITKAIFT